MTDLRQSKYHITVVAIYFFVCIYFFFFNLDPFSQYHFDKSDFTLFVPLTLGVFATFFLANRIFNYGKIGIKNFNLLEIFLNTFYCLIFAIPEEIIFRGYVQNWVGNHVSGPVPIIILSSLIFGFAHSFNGAKGLKPKDWNWGTIFLTTSAGLYLGFAYFATGSLVLPTILHTIFLAMLRIFIKP